MAIFIKSLVTLYTHDILKAADFYGRLLGFEETYRFPEQGIAEHIEYCVGTTTIAISSPAGLEAHGMPPATPGHPFEIGLKTDDVHAILQHLRAHGVTILKEPSLSAAGNQYAYIADPDGNWISVYSDRKMMLQHTPLSQFFRESPLAYEPLDLNRDMSGLRADIEL
jgi:catechol 2,3-dioxygenase-like lactoylglutathione lyase family enzyme